MALQQMFPPLLLTNGGHDKNMCSLNSNLQLLRRVPEFVALVKHSQNDNPLLNSLSSIFSKCGTSQIISASLLRQHLARVTGEPLASGIQHDTVEMLNYLLDHLDCPAATNLFYFDTSFQYRFNIDDHASPCPICKQLPKPVEGTDKFLKLPLPLSSTSITLDKLLKTHFSIQHQSEGRSCAACPASPKLPYIEKLRISKYPQYILIQILRTTFVNGKAVKNTSPVEIPEKVTVDKTVYEIIGTITHMGTADAGHNRAYLKKGSKWYLCEDFKNPIERVPKDSAFEQNYCLLLKKQSSTKTDKEGTAKETTKETIQMPILKECRIVIEPLPTATGKMTYANAVNQSAQGFRHKSLSSDNISALGHENSIGQHIKRAYSSQESLSQNSQQSDQHSNCCKGCGKSFSRFFYHLSKSKECSQHYDMVKMKQ